MIKRKSLNQSNSVDKIYVADLIFGRNNGKMIELLKERGNSIGLQEFEDIRKVEREINREIRENYDTLTTPNVVFITFEEEEATKIARANNNKRTATILGGPMHFDEPLTPTDLIWENRQKKSVVSKHFAVTGSLALLMLAQVYIVYIISSWEQDIQDMFPQIDCDFIKDMYGRNYQVQALEDFKKLYDEGHRQSSGPYQCFCADELANNYEKAREFNYGRDDGVPMCGVFDNLNFSQSFWVQSLEIVIIVFNIVLRKMVFYQINKLDYDQETKRLYRSANVIFWMQFINTAVLLFLVNANMTQSPITFGLVGGSLREFNRTWFKLIGNTIIGTMVISCTMPIVEVMVDRTLSYFEKLLDRGCCPKDDYVTRKTGIQEYIELYAGSEHTIHYGFSSLLIIIFVTFTFGFGIPILFPIAAFALSILYRVEKFSMYYIYQKPPMYDKEVTQMVTKTLRLAPALYLIVGYVMFTNQQLISNNHLHPIKEAGDTPRSDNDILKLFFSAAGWASPYWPIGAMAIIVLFLYVSLDWINEKILVKDIGDSLWELDEGLDNYWAALSKIDRKWYEHEEHYKRNALNMQMMTEEQFARLKTPAFKRQQVRAQRLYNTHTYDILANPYYVNHFQYVSASVGSKRRSMIIDSDSDDGNNDTQSDLTRICLNLAFLPEQEGRAFQFSKTKMAEEIEMRMVNIKRQETVPDQDVN